MFVSNLAKFYTMYWDLLMWRSTVTYTVYSKLAERPGSDGRDLQYNVWLEAGILFFFAWDSVDTRANIT